MEGERREEWSVLAGRDEILKTSRIIPTRERPGQSRRRAKDALSTIYFSRVAKAEKKRKREKEEER